MPPLISFPSLDRTFLTEDNAPEPNYWIPTPGPLNLEKPTPLT